MVYDWTMGRTRHARTLMPMPRPQKGSPEIVQAVAATPWSLREASKPEVIKLDPAGLPQEERREKVTAARRLYICQKDLVDLATHGRSEERRG